MGIFLYRVHIHLLSWGTFPLGKSCAQEFLHSTRPATTFVIIIIGSSYRRRHIDRSTSPSLYFRQSYCHHIISPSSHRICIAVVVSYSYQSSQSSYCICIIVTISYLYQSSQLSYCICITIVVSCRRLSSFTPLSLQQPAAWKLSAAWIHACWGEGGESNITSNQVLSKHSSINIHTYLFKSCSQSLALLKHQQFS